MKMRSQYTCPLEMTHDIIKGKWKPLIIWQLSKGGSSLSALKKSIRGISQKMLVQHLNELLEILSLKGRENHLPNQLSGGQQQRVSIGRALMNGPAVVLADEPTGNLDSKNSQEIVELLKYSNQKFNQTLIVITHDENIALQADRIIAIEDGKITRDEVIRA